MNKQIIQQHTPELNTLPRDFAEFLKWMPPGWVFNLWNIQGAMRLTREGIPNYQSYAPELDAAQRLGLIESADEDVRWSEDEWERGYPRHLHAGQQFKRTERKIDLRSCRHIAPNARKQPIFFAVGRERAN